MPVPCMGSIEASPQHDRAAARGHASRSARCFGTTAQAVRGAVAVALCCKATVAATAKRADGCVYEHNPNLGMLGYGENLYACASSDESCFTTAPNQSVLPVRSGFPMGTLVVSDHEPAGNVNGERPY